ncbi:MAG: flagellar basal-body MS-ring/collar protein FliF [Phenylobacterium sp.]
MMGGFEGIAGLNRRQLAVAAAALALTLVAMGAVYLLVLRSPYMALFSDLRTADAATIVAELEKKKIPYRLADGGATILVPAKVADATRLSVMSEDLPLKGTVGFELFNKSDMGLTEFAQQINYRRALQGELARTIMALEGVESARVHLSLAEPAVFREDRRPSKASVTLILREGRTAPEGTVRGIQSLVAAAVPDLDPAGVVVLDAKGLVMSAPAPGALHTQGAPSELEAWFADAVRLALRQFYPDRRFEVLVSAPTGAEAPMGDAADAFDPAARTFPIEVKVLVEGELTDEMRTLIQRLAVSAASLDPAQGDALAVVPLGAAVREASAPAAPAPTGATSPTGSRAPSTPSASVLAVLGAILLGLFGAAWLLHRRNRPRTLTQAQKRALAAKLQLLLVEDTAHAPR